MNDGMKIVLCNKYFFLNGGTERYLCEVSKELARAGHSPIPFSIAYSGSWSSPYSRFFLPPPGPPNQAHFKDIRLTPTSLLRFLDRSIYSFEARKKLSALLEHTDGADIGYVLNVYNYMSHSIIHTFRRRGIPVVMRLGDYHLLCPSYLLLRKARPCTLCLSGNYLHAIRHRCVKGRTSASAIRVLSMVIQRHFGLIRSVDAFVTPCRFMRSMLVRGGFPEERIHVIPTLVTRRELKPSLPRNGRYILYFGRVVFEKGLDMLMEAYQRLTDPGADLILMGRSYDGERERLERLIRPEFRDRIRFLGFKDGGELSHWISGALFSVVPSRWYDNAPLSVYESFLEGVPVLAANIGGIPEQVDDGVTGRLFNSESVDDLHEGLVWMLSDPSRLEAMGNSARKLAEQRCSMQAHMGKLLALFSSLRK